MRWSKISRHPHRPGIFAQLLLAFLLVALLPLTVFWQLEQHRAINAGEAAAQEGLRLFSVRVVQQVDDWTALNLSVMKLAASLPDLLSADPLARKRVITLTMHQLPWAYLIHALDLTGMDVARSDASPDISYWQRDYVTRIRAGAPYDAEIRIGITSHKPAFLLSVPLRDGAGHLRGVLDEAATLVEVRKAVTSANLGKTGFAFLLTPSGQLIASAHEPSNQDLKDDRAHPAFIAAQANRLGIQHYTLDGVERVAIIQRTALGWIAVVQQDVAENMGGVIQAQHYVLIVLGITAAIVSLLSLLVARSFAAPIEKITAVADQISRGQLDFSITTTRRDQIGDLIRAMQGVRGTLQTFVDAQRQMASEHQCGDLDFRIDASVFQGVYQEMARATNELVGDQVTLTLMLRDAIERYAIGDFSAALPLLPGKKRALTEATESARMNLMAMQEQIVRLVEAAARGDFSERGDPLRFQNAFRSMVRHLNHLMATADRGLGEVALVLAAIARGDLTVTMQGLYEGTFANLKRDTNATVQALATLIQQIEFNRGLLRATLEHLPQGVSVVDADLRLIAWNRRYLEIFGFPSELVAVGQPIEALLRHNAGVGLFKPLDAEAQIQRRLTHLRSGSTHAHQRELPGGVVLEVRGSPIPELGYVTSYADVSAYKRVEDNLRALAESLERRVTARTRDLQQATAEAERANRSKSKFLAAAVHDLSQPINAARLYLSAVREDLRDHPTVELVERAERSLAPLDSVFDSLMDISRLESGKLSCRIEDFPLRLLLESLTRQFEILARTRQIQLHCVMVDASVHTDFALLRRVLQNFLSNAISYTERGKVLLGVRRIHAGVRIEVWDTGIGIAADNLEEIFEEFHRLDTARARAEPGAGLGLAIVNTIARLLDLHIGVRSWPGRGSVFSIDVPHGAGAQQPALEHTTSTPPASLDAESPGDSAQAQAARHAVQLSGSTDAGALHGLRVWCVEDDDAVREAMRALLHGWGCDATTFASGETCLQAARGGASADMLLLDYRIGDGLGTDLPPKLEAIWHRRVPAILISGDYSGPQHEPLVGVSSPVMVKPIQPEALRTRMLDLLTRTGAGRRGTSG